MIFYKIVGLQNANIVYYICHREVFMKKIYISLLIIAIVAGVTFGLIYYLNRDRDSVAAVTFNLNPAIQCIIDETDKVVAVTCLDAEAEILLADTDLIGEKIEEAAEIFTQLCIDAGYIDCNSDGTLDDNVIEYTIVSSDDALELRIQSRIRSRINELFDDHAIYGRARKMVTSATTTLEQKYSQIATYLQMDTSEFADLSEKEILNLIKERSKVINRVRTSLRSQINADLEVQATKTLINNAKTAIETEVAALELAGLTTSTTLDTLKAQLLTYVEQLQTRVDALITDLADDSVDYYENCSAQLRTRVTNQEQVLETFNQGFGSGKHQRQQSILTWREGLDAE